MSGHIPLPGSAGQNINSIGSEDSSGSFGGRIYDWLGIDTILSILRPGESDVVTEMQTPAATLAGTPASSSPENAGGSATQPASPGAADESKTAQGAPAESADSDKTGRTTNTAASDTAKGGKTAKTADADTEEERKTADTAASDTAKGGKTAKTADADTEEERKTAGTAASDTAKGDKTAKTADADTADGGKTAQIAAVMEETKAVPTRKTLTKLQKKYVQSWEDWHMRTFPLNFPLHDYNWKYLNYDENGILHYKGDQNYKIRRGIDVSEFQGKIDWKKVKEAGFDFVFVRVGHRTMHTGDLQRDNRAIKNLRRASDAGLDVGAYVFSQAITKKEAREEAKLCLEVIEESGVKITLPIVYDPEIVVEDYYARINYISGEQFTDNSIAFCETIRKAGYTPALYANCSTETDILDMSRLKDTVIWYADYSGTPESPYDFTFWQYSNVGRVDGIPEAETDLNVWFIEK